MELTDQDHARIALIRKMMERTGKVLDDPFDPDKVQAMEALLAIAAAKSYAMSRVFQAQADFCRLAHGADELNLAISRFNETLHDEIDLGKIYYARGIKISVKGRHVAESGEALMRGLEQKIQEIGQKMRTMTSEALDRECRELTKGVLMATELLKQ